MAADAAAARTSYLLPMNLKLWIVVIGTGLFLLALGGWLVDAVRWPLASARLHWRLALSTR